MYLHKSKKRSSSASKKQTNTHTSKQTKHVKTNDTEKNSLASSFIDVSDMVLESDSDSTRIAELLDSSTKQFSPKFDEAFIAEKVLKQVGTQFRTFGLGDIHLKVTIGVDIQ
mmetsp:Transcript_25603/g.46323  ORF Transcript_25603/g.46323 Transcript_25603/m.46323 type:complete len:112 (-) Transcript_25603:790-1125(-)